MKRTAQMLLCTVVLMSLTMNLVKAFSQFNVIPACNTMQPGHLGFGSQSSPPPYAILVRRQDDGSYLVTVYGIHEEKFKGFLLQARRDPDDSDTRLGVFTSVQKKGEIIDCGYENSAVQHRNSDQKTQVTARWNPSNYTGEVQFKATVVQSYFTYWKNILSEQISV